MKLSQQTVSLLQSFANINSNLLVKPGNKLATRNAVGSAQARAMVDEDFPVQFAIYDLNQLLSLLSVSSDPDIEFGEKSMTIKSSTGGEIEYFYADASLITAPPETDPTLESHFKFTLTGSDIQVIQKTAQIVSATMLSVVSEGKTAHLKINDPKNSTSNTYKKELDSCDKQFNVKVSMESFRGVVPDTYDVKIAHALGKGGNKVLVFHLSSTTRKLTYLIAADTTSKI